MSGLYPDLVAFLRSQGLLATADLLVAEAELGNPLPPGNEGVAGLFRELATVAAAAAPTTDEKHEPAADDTVAVMQRTSSRLPAAIATSTRAQHEEAASGGKKKRAPRCRKKESRLGCPVCCVMSSATRGSPSPVSAFRSPATTTSSSILTA